MEKTEIIILYFVAVNVLTLCVYGIDKIKAMRGGRRISEATLLLLAVSGGSIGAMLAMDWFHHKTKHRKFKYGIPAIIMIQLAVIGYIVYHIGE